MGNLAAPMSMASQLNDRNWMNCLAESLEDLQMNIMGDYSLNEPNHSNLNAFLR